MVRKRKWLEAVEDHAGDFCLKSRRLLMPEDWETNGTLTNSGTQSPIRGAKSFSGREGTDRQSKGALNLMVNEKDDEKKTPRGLRDRDSDK